MDATSDAPSGLSAFVEAANDDDITPAVVRDGGTVTVVSSSRSPEGQ